MHPAWRAHATRLFALLLLLLPLHALAAPKPTSKCGNGVAERREQCDGADLRGQTCQGLGWDTGTLACASTCTLDTTDCENLPDPVCGDGVVNQATEECDGSDLLGLACTDFGYDGGTMACDGTCGFDFSGCWDLPECGNGVVETGEECDGADLGGQTCAGLGYDGGTLGCDTGCLLDDSGCTMDPPPPEGCGNGVLDGAWEECDGADDGACPGACSDHCACPATAASGDLEIHVVDVGQGDGVVVVSPDGFVMVLDAGTDSQSATIASYLSLIGITSIDYTLVSHLHADHLGGMDGVIAAHPETVVAFDNGRSATSGEFLEYEAAIGTRRETLLAGDFVDLGPSVVAEVLHADMGSSNENNNSVVLRITYGGVRFLLGGDCESGCESSFDPGPIEVYKVHHHGSATSTTEALVAAMSPEAALISVGANNSYGHPAPSTLDRLAAHGAQVWRTDLDGDIEVLASPTGYLVNGEPPCGTACGGETGTARLAQVYYDTAGTDSIEEFVDLYNPGTGPANVGGWTLSDNGGTWTIPSGTTIPAGGFVSLARDTAGFQAHFGLSPDVSGMTLSLANSADGLTLRDALGAEIDRVAWEGYEAGWTIAATTGNSLVRTDPDVDTDGPSDWSQQAPAAPLGGF